MRLARFISLWSKPNAGPARDGTGAGEQAVALCRSLLSEHGEDGGLASETLRVYEALGPSDRGAFFDQLVNEFSPDPEEVGRCGDAYRKEPTPAHLSRLLRAAEPRRQELFRRLNLATGGTRTLVEMRRQILGDLGQHPSWAAIEADLAHLLTGWFNRAFLVLRRIDWHTPAIILEKLIDYEAVHQIQGWRDLRRRLEADRRCYAFFHPALPDEPIIFIEVALVHGMSAQVQPLLDPESPVASPEGANCAMFYSITNCQDGLRGVPFGNFLIRTVADELRREFPRLRTFATVSPLPGFLGWLAAKARRAEADPEEGSLAGLMKKLEGSRWLGNKELSVELEQQLIPLCAYYLMNAKHGKEPLDAVARFHLRNGARLERINWLGDTSAAGMQRSASLMVNYVYRLDEVESNRDLYSREHRIQASRQVERLARQSALARNGASGKPARS
ncbi:MAG: malonyl-CoA decarboxylase [Acidobacteriia bacterium]|nr:malonyl-CoA decarboxylase [Terriglobia bacterium]